jgi:hypothetical protein
MVLARGIRDDSLLEMDLSAAGTGTATPSASASAAAMPMDDGKSSAAGAGARAGDELLALRPLPLSGVGHSCTADGRGGLSFAHAEPQSEQPAAGNGISRYDLTTGAVSLVSRVPATYFGGMCVDRGCTRLFVAAVSSAIWSVVSIRLEDGVTTTVATHRSDDIDAGVMLMACLSSERLLVVLRSTVEVVDLLSGQRHTYAEFACPEADDQFVRDIAIDERSRTAILVRSIGPWTQPRAAAAASVSCRLWAVGWSII